MEPAVTVVGEALIDIVLSPSGEAVEHVGGSPANVAIGLSRLDHRTRLATHIGTDERGARIASALAAEGVQLTIGSQAAERTPTATARLDAAGVANYEFDLTWNPTPDSLRPHPGSHLHTGSIAATLAPGAAAVAAAVAKARHRSTVSYDPNVRPSLMGSPERARPVIETMIALADVVKASAEDTEWLYPGKPLPQVLADWAMLGPAVVAVTRGGADTLLLVGGELFERRPLPSKVVDTIGAGDSFMAGLISGLLDGGFLGGQEARERLRFVHFDRIAAAVDRALACAAITVSRAGANPPTRADLLIQT
ncbi:MAG: carbohydrate kinase [Propionicimonas sp.]|uniref:carbohydrate kinase family protein n=1 Tax=Propionicimonas sp. TaxID=1955623 RepID=UPI001DCE7D4F|nr:carbohydrate kinase [Propionicimonas sp.]MBU4186676.1 carbohydrate kinase [Actinomycetota bacterium]MBU4206351.1 carbohydrate kinase [Actinomycetota bacterium]MBU4248822.1 carbohydrate kinase [Actinomycetota bacterium]MBU4365394.1 carbohydrate kinase [Actinomycetota bacterium]MBU4410589.1 carbohydrate kinase [Actinomycetota bacterium]